MGLHSRHAHGRVFHGLAAREHLEQRKRDSHGSEIKMHVPEGFDLQEKETTESAQTAADISAAVQVVYVTLSQTFSGPAVYSTMTGDTASLASSSAAATVLKGGAVAATRSASSASVKATSVATVSPAQSTTLATATSYSSIADDASASASTAVGTPVQANVGSTASSTSQATTEQTQDTGMSAGGKAGLAIGIILAIALIAGLAFMLVRRKKRPTGEEALNEKHSSFPRGAPIGAAAATGAFAARQMQHGERESSKRDSTQTEKIPSSVRSTRTASTAPRLSLRPITQLMTSFGENRKSGGNALDVASNGGLAAPSQSAWERRPVNSTTENPFNDTTAQSNAPLTDPFNEKRTSNGSISQPKTSLDATVPQTPSSATFGTAAAVAVAAGAGGAAPPRGPNNVHRVQLDFKPSMDDELELRSGQLVRMLHEYDDGWVST